MPATIPATPSYGIRYTNLLANRERFVAMRKFFGDSIKSTAEFSYISIGLGMAAFSRVNPKFRRTRLAERGIVQFTPPVRRRFPSISMVDAQLHWKQPHLLEIGDKKALINDFRNVSYPFAKFGDQSSWRYKVELRLAPSSEGFSYLQGAVV